jgi:tol-pal system beta propeller repeat protein TolB
MITYRLPIAAALLFSSGCAHITSHEMGGGFFQDVSWSPDSKWIAYSVLRDKEWGIYIAHPDGSSERRISAAGSSATWTSWSPDGRELAFSSGAQGRSDIIIATIRGNDQRKLTTDGNSNSAPSWSPDGKQIAFTSKRSGKYHIYVVRTDGSDLRQITSGDANESNPQWSPDGTEIVFPSDVRGKLDVVATVKTDGKDMKLLTPADMHAIYPGWTSNGEIVFARVTEGQPREIMIIGRDGKMRSTGRSGFFSRVSPNGKAIAVIDGRYPDSRIKIDRFR